MPSPFARLAVPRSKRDQVDRVTPVPEKYAGNNIPYRGTESHGVDHEPIDHPDTGYNVVLIDDKKTIDVGQEPVPVRIVQSTGKREIRDFTANSWSVSPQSVFRIVGKNDARITVKILNSSDTLDLYIGNTDQVRNHNGGYLLSSGKDVLLTTTEPIWVYNPDNATNVVAYVLEEYSNVVND